MEQNHGRGITRRQLVVGLGASLIALVASGCIPHPPKVVPGVPTSSELAKYQILAYQGQKLDSITVSEENSISGPQYIDKAKWRLTVDGLVGKPAIYTFDELLAKFPADKQVHKLNCVEGWGENQLWEGVRIIDVLKASAPKPSATVVILHAHDGYTTSFPVDYFKPEHLLVYKINGVDITAERGAPLRLGAWSKWGYKWIRWVERLELSSDTNYRGYWESRGYDNSAELTASPE